MTLWHIACKHCLSSYSIDAYVTGQPWLSCFAVMQVYHPCPGLRHACVSGEIMLVVIICCNQYLAGCNQKAVMGNLSSAAEDDIAISKRVVGI